MNRRELLAATGGLVAAGCQKAGEKAALIPAGPDPLTGGALMHDVSIYTAFGRHRSGSSGDIATSSWIFDRWTSLGYEIEQTPFEAPNADTFRASLLVGDTSLDGFAQPPLAMTPEGGLRGVLAEWKPEKPANVSGKIAVVFIPLPASGAIPSAAYRAAYDACEKAGAIGIVGLVSGPSEEMVAINTPITATFKTPTLNLGSGTRPFMTAVIGKEATLRVEGPGGTRTAKNTIARYGKKGPWLIVSTPQSGWFNCGGERAPGVAMSLALSDWALRQKFENRLLFIATSGHEWNDAGAHIFHEKGAPEPGETALWLHLGASFGARGYDASGKNLVPLDTPNPLRTLMVSEDMEPICKDAFAGQPGISSPTIGTVEKSAGELTLVIKEGYKSYAGFFGQHALFHTPFDDDTATTPAIMEPIARACAKLIETKLRAKV
jgi:hypothetical protein